jgi:hypothetical protein
MNQTDTDLANRWDSRLKLADEYFQKWERKFKCQTLVDYYEGFQWREDETDIERYVLNLVYSTIKIKRPTLLFKRPQYKIEPDPQRADFNPEAAWQVCQIQADTLNTTVAKGYVEFAENIEMAILDSWFYFGLIEVGYSANYGENPNAPKPAFKEDYEPHLESDGKTVGQRSELPDSERIFVKRIPAHNFRVGGENHWSLSKCSWCGYWEYYRISDLLASGSGFKNTTDLKVSVSLHEDEPYDVEDGNAEKRGDLVKVWKVWDMRRKIMYMICETGPTVIYERPFKRLPVYDLRFTKRTRGWYPIPPVFSWKSSQDEQNESKEQMRAMRRRAKRQWQYVDGMVDEEELVKLTAGPDGSVIMVKQANAISPIETPGIDASISGTLVYSKDDFNIISGASSEARGVADRQTATQSNIIENRSNIREQDEREIVAEWLCKIGREVLLQIRENFTEDMWIKENSDIGAFGQDYQDIQQRFRMISPITDLGSFDFMEGEYTDDFSVQIYVESLSPVTNEQEEVKFMKFLAIINQYPQLSLNPILIREAAYRVGYRNEQVIRAMQQAAQLQMVGQIEQGQAQGGGGQMENGSNMAQTTAEQMEPPAMGQLEAQLNQVGVPQ